MMTHTTRRLAESLDASGRHAPQRVDYETFVGLLVGRRKLEREYDRAANRRTLVDLTTGERFELVSDEEGCAELCGCES